jgi:hypothetical protein
VETPEVVEDLLVRGMAQWLVSQEGSLPAPVRLRMKRIRICRELDMS